MAGRGPQDRRAVENLVVTGGGAAMRHGCRAAFARNFRQALGLQSTLCADAQWIRLTAEHIAGDEVPDNSLEEILLRFNHSATAAAASIPPVSTQAVMTSRP